MARTAGLVVSLGWGKGWKGGDWVGAAPRRVRLSRVKRLLEGDGVPGFSLRAAAEDKV